MKNINIPSLLLAILVVSMFCLVGIAISYHNYWLSLIFLILGFLFMGYGLAVKRRKSDH